MIKRVYKYEIMAHDEIKVRLPIGAEILEAQEQDGISFLWALVDPNAITEIRTFRLAGTGHPIYSEMGKEYKHISTFRVDGGLFVFHFSNMFCS